MRYVSQFLLAAFGVCAVHVGLPVAVHASEHPSGVLCTDGIVRQATQNRGRNSYLPDFNVRPPLAQSCQSVGHALSDKGNFPEADKYFDAAIILDLDPDNPNNLNNPNTFMARGINMAEWACANNESHGARSNPDLLSKAVSNINFAITIYSKLGDAKHESAAWALVSEIYARCGGSKELERRAKIIALQKRPVGLAVADAGRAVVRKNANSNISSKSGKATRGKGQKDILKQGPREPDSQRLASTTGSFHVQPGDSPGW